jgi:hypothetical protein
MLKIVIIKKMCAWKDIYEGTTAYTTNPEENKIKYFSHFHFNMI